MDYRIVEAPNSSRLQAKIVMMIEMGWEPLGGVSFVKYGIEVMWAQAVIRKIN